jgi:hypothetical protein
MYESEDNKYVPLYFAGKQAFMSFLRGVASTLCIGLAETINKIGPAFLENCPSFMTPGQGAS